MTCSYRILLSMKIRVFSAFMLLTFAAFGQDVNLVQDLHPTGSGSPSNFATTPDYMIFSARDGVHFNEPWIFNGDSAWMLMDIHPTDESEPRGFIYHQTTDQVLFTANDGNGEELWKTDGVTTSMVSDINPSGGSFPSGYYDWMGTIFFSADNGADGYELYSYDGTTVTQWGDNNPGSGSFSPWYFTEYAGNLYFSANGGPDGRELWMFDGSTATQVIDINPTGDANPQHLVVFGGELYFQADDGVNGTELWKYDGTTASLVYDINTTGNGRPQFMTVYSGKIYFKADDGINGRELWSHDGTTTVMEGNNNPVSDFDPENFHIYNSELYFTATDGIAGQELWKYDGTTFTLVQDIEPGGGASWPTEFTEFKGELYFTAETDDEGYELWKTDGSGATIIMDINPSLGNGSSPSYLTIFNNAIYFQADDGTIGTELWRLCFADSNSFSVSPCDNYTVPSGATTYSASGVYGDTIQTISGCDSLLTITLNLRQSSSASINPSVCDLYTSPDGMETWTTTGTYMDTITNMAGCDSVITVNLTVNNVGVGVTAPSGSMLTANTAGASYQWLDCDNSMMPIAGETNQSFSPSVNGNYAVIVDDGTCVDTSACQAVNGVGLTEQPAFELSIYPNPNDGAFTVNSNEPNLILEVLDLSGRVVLPPTRIYGTEHIGLEVTNGVYIVSATNGSGTAVKRLLVQR